MNLNCQRVFYKSLYNVYVVLNVCFSDSFWRQRFGVVDEDSCQRFYPGQFRDPEDHEEIIYRYATRKTQAKVLDAQRTCMANCSSTVFNDEQTAQLVLGYDTHGCCQS